MHHHHGHHHGHHLTWLARCLVAALTLASAAPAPAAAAALLTFSTRTSTSAAVAAVGGVKVQATAEAIPGGSRAIWQIPSSPRAVLLVFHGLNHGPEVFWEASAGCPACAQAGLPEEHLITRTALARRYAVLTMAALMAVGWDKRPDLAGNVDFRQLAAYLPAWTARHGLDGLPVAAFGVSRGGEFASLVPLGLPRVVSLVLMVDAGNDAAVAAAQGVGGEGGLAPYPPTLFIYVSV